MKLSAAALAASFAITAFAAVADAQCFPQRGAPPVVATPPAYVPPSFAPPVPAPRPMSFRRHARRPAPVVVVVNPAPVAPPPSDANGYLVLGDTRLVEGQPVRVEWGAGYHDAQVVRVHADGTVLIHYSGWSSMWDETVPRHRIRLPR